MSQNIFVRFVNNLSILKSVLKSLNLAHNIASKRKDVGIINCPINKELLKKKFGVTEYISLK